MSDRSSNTLITGLRHCVAWLDRVLGQLHEGVVVADERIDVVYANERLAGLLGLDRLAIVGQPLSTVLPLAESELTRLFVEVGDDASGSPRYLGDYTIGEGHIVEIRASPLDGGGGMRQVVFMLQDVTLRREAETRQQKHESELARLNITLEERVRRRTFELEALYELSTQISTALSAEDVLKLVLECLYSVQRQDVSGALICTESFQEVMLKLTRTASDTFVDNTLEVMLGALEQLSVDPVDRTRVTTRIVHAERFDATQPPMEDIVSLFQAPLTYNGKTVGMLLAGSGRKRRYAENEVRFLYTLAAQVSSALQRLGAARAEERRRLEQMVRDLPSGLLLLDRDRRLVFSNDEASRLLPLLGDAHLGDVVNQVGPLSVDTLLERGDDDALEFERPRPRQIFSVSAASSDAETVVFVRDVTREREQQQRMALQDRLAVVGQLAGGVAHDFNNLLNVILGYSELILSKLDESEPLSDDIQEIQKAGERAAVLTRQLLAFSRRQLLIPKVLDLNLVVADMDKLLRRLIGEDIELVTILDPHLGHLRADPGQIEQVIMNLAVNARDAMPRGGRLTIETANVTVDELYVHSHIGAKAGAYVLLAVTDTGTGMEPEVKERIFEPFFTTKEQSKGTGLGLATVYGIVKQSGGNIWVYSELDCGTTFKIYMPMVEGTAVLPATRPAPPAPEETRGTETILLVEDELEVRTLVARLLREHGYSVLVASHGHDAMKTCAGWTLSIDLLVTDVVMPAMSGRELAEVMLQNYPRLKVLYMSGYTDDAVFRQGILAEGVPFMQKPFTAEALTSKVRQVLDSVPRTVS